MIYGVYKIVGNGTKKHYAYFINLSNAKEYIKFLNLKEIAKMSNDDIYYTSYIEVEQKYFIDEVVSDTIDFNSF